MKLFSASILLAVCGGLAAIFFNVFLISSKFTFDYGSAKCDELDLKRVLLNGDMERTPFWIDSVSKLPCDKLHLWVYKTINEQNSSAAKKPAIILSHGLGAQKDMGLEQYAIDFALEGFVVFVLDYRTFGGSSLCAQTELGVRNLIHPWNHVQDIISVVEWSRQHENVDSDRVALWGTSFAGGHMISVASMLNSGGFIRAVVSQVPHMSGKGASARAIKSRGMSGTIQILTLGVIDSVRNWLGLSPLYIKIVGESNDPLSYMQLSANQIRAYFQKHPRVYLGCWKNLAPARSVLSLSLYNPIDSVAKISVPILFIAATQDQLCPLDDVARGHRLSLHKESRLVEINCTHFEIYSGSAGAEARMHMKNFLKMHVP